MLSFSPRALQSARHSVLSHYYRGDLGLNRYHKGGWFADIAQGYGLLAIEALEDEWMWKQNTPSLNL
ncbi:hypothetical protein NPX13_g9579 [Xylaria arbuscula]|uniref:Uncharacterized protein n=1 Tax=Xylaria arbuscula TaxID=114810 RepID=A0A9W8N6F8_9PEZI|nr:hypothetical protein NPX13_g9579 [Xylaria arbuscula]